MTRTTSGTADKSFLSLKSFQSFSRKPSVFGFAPQSFVISIPLLILLGIGMVSLLLMIVVQAIKNRNWRATSLGPYPVSVAVAAIAVLIGSAVIGLELPLRPLTNLFKRADSAAELSSPPANAAVVSELRELVAQSEQDLLSTRQRHAAGTVPASDVARAEQGLLEAKIRLNVAESRMDKVLELRDELVKVHESALKIAEACFAAGTLSQAELSQVRRGLTESRIQREAARQH